MRIDVYPVGMLANLRHAWRSWRHPKVDNRHAWIYIRYAFRSSARHIRNRQWRELKNDFNGYLAEPTPWPEGATRCGSGWTRKRALRSLRLQVRRPGVLWEESDRAIQAELMKVSA